MPFIWDAIDQWVAEVKIVGEGILDGQKILAVRYGPVTEWLSPDEIHDTIDEKLKEKERLSKGIKAKKEETEYDNTEDRPSLLSCPKCKKPMKDIYKIKTQGGKLVKTAKRLDVVCRDCGYSLAGVDYPKGKLIERLT